MSFCATGATEADAADEVASSDELIELISDELVGISELISDELIGISELIMDELIDMSELMSEALIDISDEPDADEFIIPEESTIPDEDIISDDDIIIEEDISDEIDMVSLALDIIMSLDDELSCASAWPATSIASAAVDPTKADRNPTSLITLSL